MQSQILSLHPSTLPGARELERRQKRGGSKRAPAEPTGSEESEESVRIVSYVWADEAEAMEARLSPR